MTTIPPKPMPAIDPDSEPYWAALRDERLILKSCSDCGRAHFYPRELCPYCHSDQLIWVESAGRGAVYSFTVCRKPAGPAFAGDIPYVVALVDLDDGPRMMTRIADDWRSVAIGMKVKVRFERQSDDLVLPFFERAEDS